MKFALDQECDIEDRLRLPSQEPHILSLIGTGLAQGPIGVDSVYEIHLESNFADHQGTWKSLEYVSFVGV
jgi:hypothetical protein